MSRRTAVWISFNSLVHSPLSSPHNMISLKGVVILCCVFLLSAAVPIREEAGGAASIAQHKCEKDGEVYETGTQLNNNEEPCQLCYCQKGTLVCAVISCYHRDDCEPRFVPGRCCPKYDHCPALGEKKDEVLLPVINTVEDDIKEFPLGDDPSAYFAGNPAISNSEEHKSAEPFDADIKLESAARSEEGEYSRANDQRDLDLFKSLTDTLVESTTDKLQNEENVGEPNLSGMQQQDKTFDSKNGNDKESTEHIMAEENAKLDYQNEEHEDENTQQNAGEPNLSERQQDKSLVSKEGSDNGSSEETLVRSIVKLGYQDEEHEEENNQQNVEDAQSSEYKESLQSKQENYGSSEVPNEEIKGLEHQHENQQDVQQKIGEQDSEMHPFKEPVVSAENNQGARVVIQPDYQDDESEQQSSQQNVGESDSSQYEETKQTELEYDIGTTEIITESNDQGEESLLKNLEQHTGKQDSSEVYLNGESPQHKSDGATEEVITEINLHHRYEQEHKQENEQPVGEQASLERSLDEDGNNDDTTEVIVTESYINFDHQDDEHKTENQPNEGESNFSEMPLDEESWQSKEESDDGTTEVVPVKKDVKHDNQDKHDNDQHNNNIGEPHSSEHHYSEEELRSEGNTQASITERSMNLDSGSEENHMEKKQQDEGEQHLSETQDSEENIDNTQEATEATSIEKIPLVGTNTPVMSSHDGVTELPHSAEQAVANGEGMENDYTIYRGEYIEGPRTAHYVKFNNGKFNYIEDKVHKEATTEDNDTPTLKNSTDENTSREKEPNDSLKLPYSEEGSGSSRIYDCAGGKEECAFLVKEWKILMPQLAMTPLPSPVDFWEYYEYSSSEVQPVSYDDPEEVLILLPHPPQSDQKVAESLDNTAEFAMQHKVQDTNHIL